jgi:hypothetical protein
MKIFLLLKSANKVNQQNKFNQTYECYFLKFDVWCMKDDVCYTILMILIDTWIINPNSKPELANITDYEHRHSCTKRT